MTGGSIAVRRLSQQVRLLSSSRSSMVSSAFRRQKNLAIFTNTPLAFGTRLIGSPNTLGKCDHTTIIVPADQLAHHQNTECSSNIMALSCPLFTTFLSLPTRAMASST